MKYQLEILIPNYGTTNYEFSHASGMMDKIDSYRLSHPGSEFILFIDGIQFHRCF